jgi:hypothetical protein
MTTRLRQDAIVRSLRRNGTSTVADLAAEVGASRRTVLRDVCALRDEGFVIHSEPVAAAACDLIRNRSRPRLGFRSPRSSGCSSALHQCGPPGICPSRVSRMLGLPKSRGPCRRTSCVICAGFWIASMSGSFHRRSTFRTWGKWTRPCSPHSRRHFSKGGPCASSTETQMAPYPIEMLNHKPC